MGSLDQPLTLATDAGFVCGHSRAIQRVDSVVEEIAGTDIPVLLTGESGTGKEVYARLIHRLSARKHLPLKKLSCAMLEPTQLLSELNSYQSEISEPRLDGAGTVYLDRVDELDLSCQKALLSVLSDEEMDEPRRCRVRLLSSASQVLDREIESGRFRRELYFRINGVGLQLPPLQERKEDIPVLMENFLKKHAAELGKSAPVLSEKDLELLQGHTWPGNIRELGNLARRIVALGNPATAIAELYSSARSPTGVQDKATSSSLKVAARTASRQAERELILKTLKQTHWNRKRAAQELQISYKSLLYKIKQTGVDRTNPEDW